MVAFFKAGIVALITGIWVIFHGVSVEAVATASVVNWCKYPVWCAIVPGYAPNDPKPQSERPPVK
jgi:hypothetical protein